MAYTNVFFLGWQAGREHDGLTRLVLETKTTIRCVGSSGPSQCPQK